MRTYDEALAAARDGTPFSNNTEWEIWSYNWCEDCLNDSPEMVDRGEGCPLIMVALMGKTPQEWTGEWCDYVCSEFRWRPDDDGDDPEPEPEPPPVIEGQLDIFAEFAEQITQQATDLAVSR